MISVALCTYDGERYIEEQLKSILNQTLPVDEIIICDDASQDNTIKIIEKFQVNDSKIKLFKSKKNSGTIQNFAKAISLTKGDIIFLSDQDDIWHSDKVKLMTDFFQKEEKCLMLFTNGNLVDENGIQLDSTLWQKWKFDDIARKSWENNSNAMADLIHNINYVTGATVAFKSVMKTEILPIETPVRFWHDAWIAMHAAYLNGLFFLNENTIDYRIHQNQQIGVNTQNNTLDVKHITFKKYKSRLMHKFPEYSEIIKLVQEEKSFTERVRNKIFRFFLKK